MRSPTKIKKEKLIKKEVLAKAATMKQDNKGHNGPPIKVYRNVNGRFN